MTSFEFTVLDYKPLGTRKFAHWVRIKPNKPFKGRSGRKEFITYFSGILGPLGEKWEYLKEHNNFYILKFNEESNLLFFLLKYKRS